MKTNRALGVRSLASQQRRIRPSADAMLSLLWQDGGGRLAQDRVVTIASVIKYLVCTRHTAWALKSII